ncbi:MAG: glucosylceramidase [Lachnospiraceae bacterium]|nr:glucosylceramidase [Lachnospiraceae bacterium]
MKLQIYETNYGKNRFMEKLPTVEFYDDKPDPDGREDRLLNIYPEARYQEIVGFGGAMTEATALNLEYMGEELHKKAMELYFDSEKGIGYSLIRSTINSCDFSKDFYSYDEVEGDHELKNFDISHDREYIIPALKEAFETAEELKLYCSPWSPPAWMKTNGRMNRGGKLKNDCYQTWAHYFTKFIQEYEKEGVKVWGVTPQNEAKAEQNWESCFYSKEEEAEFTNKYLKPDLTNNGLGDVKIFVWDHNKERTLDRALTIFKDKRITGEKGYEGPDGIAVHWYSGEHFAALDAFHNVFPDKLILGSEHSKSAGKTPEDSGERYAHDIIGDLNNYSNGWTDWNMILDEEGNPDHWKDEQIESGWAPEKIWVGEAPVVFDKKKKKLDIRSSYYYMGHISKFVRPGAVRIG